jgi:hypothetical protein
MRPFLAYGNCERVNLWGILGSICISADLNAQSSFPPVRLRQTFFYKFSRGGLYGNEVFTLNLLTRYGYRYSLPKGSGHGGVNGHRDGHQIATALGNGAECLDPPNRERPGNNRTSLASMPCPHFVSVLAGISATTVAPDNAASRAFASQSPICRPNGGLHQQTSVHVCARPFSLLV